LALPCIFFLSRKKTTSKTRYVVFATIVHAVHWPNKYAFSNNSYYVQFNFFAKAVSDSTEIKANRKFSSLRGLSKSITSYSMSAGMSWPFVFPDFEIQTSEVSNLWKSSLLSLQLSRKKRRTTGEALLSRIKAGSKGRPRCPGTRRCVPGEFKPRHVSLSDEVDTTRPKYLFLCGKLKELQPTHPSS
jgi:hypothetical protein